MNTAHIPLLSEQSTPSRTGINTPSLDVPKQSMPNTNLLRAELDLPELSQPEVVRYFTCLSQKNLSIDTNFYPLGSCTMKHNPKINDLLASAPGFASLHPEQPDAQSQGALELLYNLQNYLGEITALPKTSLAPLAGAQGEYAGLSVARSWFKDKGENERNIALVPDSAHGTNPASARMAGLEVKTVASNKNGDVDIDSLASLLDEKTAIFMLTLPNTQGIFEPNILQITKMVHDVGGLVYADGANLNALLGLVRFGDLGFDICHSNLHKTFSTPHGGGGPGAGPIMVKEELGNYLPSPVVVKQNGQFALSVPPKSVGRMGMFHGSFGILVRAYAYILSIGVENLPKLSENAIINANYIQQKLRDKFVVATGDRPCMHETVLSATKQAKRGVKALDIAKRLLDFGIHSPTMYFPLIVEEALMIEPTESESKSTLDNFVEVMRQIDDETINDPDKVKGAPYTMPLNRPDEVKAARNPILKYQKSVK